MDSASYNYNSGHETSSDGSCDLFMGCLSDQECLEEDTDCIERQGSKSPDGIHPYRYEPQADSDTEEQQAAASEQNIHQDQDIGRLQNTEW